MLLFRGKGFPLTSEPTSLRRWGRDSGACLWAEALSLPEGRAGGMWGVGAVISLTPG